jgi:hypothetical protein
MTAINAKMLIGSLFLLLATEATSTQAMDTPNTHDSDFNYPIAITKFTFTKEQKTIFRAYFPSESGVDKKGVGYIKRHQVEVGRRELEQQLKYAGTHYCSNYPNRVSRQLEKPTYTTSIPLDALKACMLFKRYEDLFNNEP